MIYPQFTCYLPSQSRDLPITKAPHLDDKVIEEVLSSLKFKDYIAKIDAAPANIEVSHIEIVSVEMFSKGVGFINIRAKTQDNGHSLPSYVFIRGKAVGVLLLVNNKMLLVKQYRVPLQQYTLECPAGMLDQDGDFKGAAAKQIEEETGIKIIGEKLQYLVEMVSSGGASDETITMYSYQVNIEEKELDAILTKMYGKGQHEKIWLKLQDFTVQNVLDTKDSKLISAALAYHAKKRNIK